MKIVINTLLLLMVGFGAAIAQNSCGTIQDEAFMQDLIDNKANWNKTVNKGYARRFVPITFHLVAKTDGTGRIIEDDVYETVCKLNERYETAGVDMSFYIKEFNEINNTGIWGDPFNYGPTMESFKDNLSMNIFVVNDIMRDEGEGRTLGYFTRFHDFICMRAANMGDAGYTIEHEIGHFFTLAHTHKGWEDAGWNPNDYPEKIEFLEIGSSQTSTPSLVELVDGSNCEQAADLICDTPPDYGRGFTCSCCVLTETILDRNCDTLAPMMNNIMSYSGGCATWEFSPDQIIAIQTSYDANNRTYLRQGDINTYTPIVDTMIYTSPANRELVDVYDKVTLRWEEVPNAEFYQVTINNVNYRAESNSFTVTDLTPNQTFNIWGVRAYNKFGGKCIDYKSIYFNVGDKETSAVSELSFVESVNVFPNPVLKNGDINISLDSQKNFKAEVLVYDLTGKLVYSEKSIGFGNGDNLHAIPAGSLDSGIHILEVRTAEGSITEKLIVE